MYATNEKFYLLIGISAFKNYKIKEIEVHLLTTIYKLIGLIILHLETKYLILFAYC